MKKFLSLLAVAVVALVAMSAQAKTVTFTIDNPEAAYLIETSNGTRFYFNGENTKELSLDDQMSIVVEKNTGFDITSISVNGNAVSGTFINYSLMTDGSTVNITTAKAEVKTVTFTVDNPAAISLYNPANYSNIYFGDVTSQTVTVSPGYDIIAQVVSGYELTGITIDGAPFSFYAGASSVNIPAAQMTNGGTVAFTTKEKEATIVYVVADPTQVSLVVDYSNVYDASNFEDGKWTIKVTNPYASMQVKAESGYVISSILNDNNQEQLYQKNQSTASIYLGGVASGTTFTVSCAELATLRTGHFSVEVVDGEASQVTVRRGGAEVPATEFGDIAYILESELPVTISSADYSKQLYKVTLNGEEQTGSYGTYYFYSLPADAQIKVWPNFPDQDVAVRFSFTNEGTEGAVKNVQVDGQTIDAATWQSADFSVKMGSRLGVEFNTGDYNVQSVTLNGESQSTYGFQTTISSAEGVNIEVTATKLRDYSVTAYFEPGTIKIFRGWGDNDPIEIPEGAEEVTFTVSPASNVVRVTPAEGYIVTSVEDTNGNVYSNNTVYVYSDLELIVIAEKFDRDLTAVFYLDEATTWNYTDITLSPNNGDLRKTLTPKAGYNFVEFSEHDAPTVYFSPTADIYLNGEKIESNYGTFPALKTMGDKSVVKVYPEGTTVDTYNLTISVDETVSVSILADYITPLESDRATVLGPTDIEFIAIARAAADDETPIHPFVVEVNNAELVPQEDGRVIAHISSDSEIAVKPSPNVGISEITVDSADQAIYNLQGVRVVNPGKGIFIKNGKKVVF